MFVQLVNIKVVPEQRSQFIEAFRINCEGTRQEPGNIRFDLLHDADDENNFYVYEIFEDEAALDAHRQTEHYRQCVEMIDPITKGDRSKSYFTPILIQGS